MLFYHPQQIVHPAAPQITAAQTTVAAAEAMAAAGVMVWEEEMLQAAEEALRELL